MTRIKQNVASLDFEKGDQIDADDINTLMIEVYNKINFLIPDNIKTVTSGQFVDTSSDPQIYYPNYIGKISNVDTKMDYISVALRKEISKINNVLDKVRSE